MGKFIRNILDFFKIFSFSKHFWLLVFCAFTFSVLARLYWVFWASNFAEFSWNNELMINTNDGYAFAEGARDLIAGFHQENDLSYNWSSLSILTAFLCKILPFSFETIILYMSVFFSSLIAVGVLFVSHELGHPKSGFIAALLSCVANSYYNRTMAGYYDTDMLNIVFCVFILWAMIRILIKQDKRILFILPFLILSYLWWYYSSFTLICAMIGIFTVYVLIFDRKNLLNYQTITLMIVAITHFNSIYIKIFIILFACVAFLKINFKFLQILAILFFSIAAFIFFGGLNPIIFVAKFYIFRDISDNIAQTAFKFFNVNQTIVESGFIDINMFMRRISGFEGTFFISVAGYIYLCFKHKIILLSLPILALGFLSLKSGLRFTIYAVPILALGFGFIVTNIIRSLNLNKILSKFLILLIVALSLYHPLKHIYEYNVSTVFYESEVKILDQMKNIASREDYFISWWDYGYPIRYYSDVKTLIDGGKHLGMDNYPVSFSLFKDQISSANMSRLAVEYTEKNYKSGQKLLLETMLKDHNETNINEFLNSLKYKNFSLPKKTREIYYYLPDRMLNIFSTVMQFSNLDLKDGKSYKEPFFYPARPLKQTQTEIALGNSVYISKTGASFRVGNEKIMINSFIITSYDDNQKLTIQAQKFDERSNFYIIYMKDYSRFIILDKESFDSAFVQLFVFENYDKEIFEPIILSPVAKIYKLKR